MKKILPILGLATAIAFNSLNSNAQSNKTNTNKSKDQIEQESIDQIIKQSLIENMSRKIDILDESPKIIIEKFGRDTLLNEVEKEVEKRTYIRKRNEILDKTAQEYADWLAKNPDFKNHSGDGLDCMQRAEKNGFTGKVAEIITYANSDGRTPIKFLIDEYRTSKEHTEIITRTDSIKGKRTDIGIGYNSGRLVILVGLTGKN